MQRTQIYLDDAQTSVLDDRARRAGRTRSDIIREAIDRYLAEDARTEAETVAWQKEAIMAAFGTEPDIAESVEELRRAGRRRQQELDARWESPR